MITLHHLNQSRSERILWLLEELDQPYEVVTYQRDAHTHLAPESLKQVHPLGKSPVIELDGHVIAESGAITEHLITRFAAERLQPALGTAEHAEYLQWIHFAESSLMLPLLMEMFIQIDGCDTNFMADYAANERHKVLGYLEQSLSGKTFIVADKLTGADMMLCFVVDMLKERQALDNYPNIAAYAQRIAAVDSYQRAMRLNAEYDDSQS